MLNLFFLGRRQGWSKDHFDGNELAYSALFGTQFARSTALAKPFSVITIHPVMGRPTISKCFVRDSLRFDSYASGPTRMMMSFLFTPHTIFPLSTNPTHHTPSSHLIQKDFPPITNARRQVLNIYHPTHQEFNMPTGKRTITQSGIVDSPRSYGNAPPSLPQPYPRDR